MTDRTMNHSIPNIHLANPYINQHAYALAEGSVLAYPTEAVWGLGCDPFNEQAVNTILQLKNRSVSKGVILIASHINQVSFLLHDLSAGHIKQLQSTWPGPHTWLVPHNNRVPSFIHGDFDTVAVRVSAHPVVQALCSRFGGPIVSTSCNPQGLPEAKTQLKARCYFANNRFGHTLQYCSGSVGKAAKPSTIQHLMTGDIIRAG